MEDIDTFINGDMFYGNFSFPTMKDKPWYGFVYVTTNDKKNEFKVGFTNYDINRRGKELRRDRFALPIFLWASPNPQILEKTIKQKLVQFTDPNGTKYRTEVFLGLNIAVIIKVIRLLILYTVLNEGWLVDAQRLNILKKYFGGVSFNVIKYKTEIYKTNIKIEEGEGYPIGTRVMVNIPNDGINEGVVDGPRIMRKRKLVKKSTTVEKESKEKVGAYKVYFADTNTYQTYTEDIITPLYQNIDIDRVLELDAIYAELKIEDKPVLLRLNI